jgi:NAD(P)-dependent dehydrogenase (short-subunit alcohol dehydrogenase family)
MSAPIISDAVRTGPLGDKESLREVLDFAALTRWEGGSMRSIATVPAKRAAGPDEVAAAAVDLAREYADYVHGTTLTFDSGGLAV